MAESKSPALAALFKILLGTSSSLKHDISSGMFSRFGSAMSTDREHKSTRALNPQQTSMPAVHELFSFVIPDKYNLQLVYFLMRTFM